MCIGIILVLAIFYQNSIGIGLVAKCGIGASLFYTVVGVSNMSTT